MPIAYPETLPRPSAWSLQPAERRRRSDLADAGAEQYRAGWRDFGAIAQASWVYTPAEMLVWTEWLPTIGGGTWWFAASLPGPDTEDGVYALQVVRYADEGGPQRELLDGGNWRVSGRLEVRGASLLPEASGPFSEGPDLSEGEAIIPGGGSPGVGPGTEGDPPDPGESEGSGQTGEGLVELDEDGLEFPVPEDGGGGDEIPRAHTLLLAHYDGNLTDLRGHGHPEGVYISGYTSGKFGSAAGTSGGGHSYWAYGPFSELVENFFAHDFTVEFWLRSDWGADDGNGWAVSVRLESEQTYTYEGSTLPQRNVILWGGQLGQINFRASQLIDDDTYSHGAFASASWTHIAAVYDGASQTITVYVDGSPVISNASVVPLGGPASGACQLKAVNVELDEGGLYIDELRIVRMKMYTSQFYRPAVPFAI